MRLAAAALFGGEGPDASNAFVDDLVNDHDLERPFADTGYALMIDDLIAEDHAVQHIGMEAGAVEPRHRVKTSNSGRADEREIGRRRAVHADLLAEAGQESFQIARVVSIELALHYGFGIQRISRTCVHRSCSSRNDSEHSADSQPATLAALSRRNPGSRCRRACARLMEKDGDHRLAQGEAWA